MPDSSDLREVPSSPPWQGEVDFYALAETLPALVFVSDASGANLYTNGRMQHYAGMGAKALLGSGWLDMVHPEDQARAQRTWNHAVVSGEPYEAEYRLRAADGSHHWHLVRGSAIREQGRIVRWVGAAVDIEAQKRTEAAQRLTANEVSQRLAESEERLRLAQEAGGVGSYEWDLATGTGYVSDSLRRIFGLEPDQPGTLATLFAAVHREDRRKVAEAIAHVSTGPDLSTTEYRIVRPVDGEVRWLCDTGRTLSDAQGAATRWLGIVRDITEQQEAQLQLKASGKRLRMALAAGQLGTWVLDVEAGAVSIDNLAALICGLPANSVRDIETARMLVHPGDVAQFDAFVEATRAGAREFDDELRIIRGDDDEPRWVRLQGVRVRGSGGAPKIIGVVSDTTERKVNEQRQKLLAREIELRSRNLLALVQSVVQLTREEDLEEFKRTIRGRIEALARTHGMLADAGDGVPLVHLVAAELARFSDSAASCVEVCGPMATLRPSAAEALALVLHELATNAAKYGALSTANGRLNVTWAVVLVDDRPGRLALHWRERGGPPAKPPVKRGVGASIMAAIVERRLNGVMSFNWAHGGLCVDITIPGEQLGDCEA